MVQPMMEFQSECEVTSNGVFLGKFCAVTHALIARPNMENQFVFATPNTSPNAGMTVSKPVMDTSQMLMLTQHNCLPLKSLVFISIMPTNET